RCIVRRGVWPLIRDGHNVRLLSTSNGQPSWNRPSMLRSQVCFPESRKYDRRLLSSDVIGKELSAERLSEASCLGLSFEGLDFVADALISPPRPFRFGREWPANICETAELAQALPWRCET